MAAPRRIRTHQAASWSDFGSLVVRGRMEHEFKNLVFWSKVTSGWPVLSLEFRFQAKPVEQKYKHKRSSQARAARPWPGCEAIVYTHLYATLHPGPAHHLGITANERLCRHERLWRRQAGVPLSEACRDYSRNNAAVQTCFKGQGSRKRSILKL